ncbi:Vacuolar protein-sorting protein [Penicillium chrysogenum]|uniref:BRO domain-containing protein 1 n=1 Tax=Penicillium chrysogenum TaxID=5076 RepID=A0A167RTF1_PENCH|nr:uncharacterized protein N7525_009761 [Penicillium rubens]KAJ5053165.1 bck1-like resistance to osmotic shock [Penicillium rubens]KAJ5831508.1 hypothetical protein N7525_009761 [Penicillium rubens]KZN86419.1 Vacuolar protein-sorting protein [Penicillium chrysogenum]
MAQSPMLSCPLKQTNEIDWVQPLKDHIRGHYNEDPEQYSQECETLNRLRQDMRGVGKDSAISRDLLYRYYAQLELVDLRFPVNDREVRISFTWYDAFTHTSASQFSMAFEKASVLFNLSAILSCHAANQSRAGDTGLKTAYHYFQASAGMFKYLNTHFANPPSTDMDGKTINTLINVTLAQAQEVFFEKQVADQRKPALLAKLAAEAAYLYSQAAEIMQNFVAKNVFDKVWTIVVQAKAAHMGSVASYYQAVTDSESESHGIAIARLQMADKQSGTALSWAKAFPSSPPANTNLTAESGPKLLDLIKHNQTNVQALLGTMAKDNDFIYHQPVPNEAGLSPVARVTAAKPLEFSELYQGQDIEDITGPDIFDKLEPEEVTKIVSLYSEEKAKLLRAEDEKAETASSEMRASLPVLELPGSLDILKGGMNRVSVDEEFCRWCSELAGHNSFHRALDELQTRKQEVLSQLDQCSKQLDLEESVCEKMRSKYGADWGQQPSSRLNTTLRGDVRSYRDTVNEASASDSQLSSTLRQYESDFDEMRSAGETDEADVLFQRALIKIRSKQSKSKDGVTSPAEGTLLDDVYDEGGASVAEQIAKVEGFLKKLNLVDQERFKLLNDLRSAIHDENTKRLRKVVLLNLKKITGHEQDFFKEQLEKFLPYQNRLLKANYNQSYLVKELDKIHDDLRQDRRFQSEKSKYESITKQRNSVLARYKKVYKAFHGLSSGIKQARTFYKDMGENVDSLRKNVETFINNRRSEGAQLLSQIERDKGMGKNADSIRRNAEAFNKNREQSRGVSGQEDREREKLRQLMERLSTEPQNPSALPSTGSAKPPSKVKSPPPPVQTPAYGTTGPSPKPSPRYPPTMPGVPLSQSPAPYGQYIGGGPGTYQTQHFQQGAAAPLSEGYNPMAYPYQTPVSPPPSQQFFSQTPAPYGGYPNSGTPAPGAGPQPSHYVAPQGYIPPPPPPRPQETNYPPTAGGIYPSGPGGYAQSRQYGHHRTPSQSQSQSGSSADPWAGLNAWK